jgi:hypothetical protein
MAYLNTVSSRSQPDRTHLPKVAFCEEKHRLLDDFLQAVRELNILQNQQTQAVIAGDPDFARFDVLLHIAQERKDMAKYAWMGHIEAHHCEEG